MPVPSAEVTADVVVLLVIGLLVSLAWWRPPPGGRTDGPARRGHPRGAKPEKSEPLLPRRGLIRHQPGRPANVAAVSPSSVCRRAGRRPSCPVQIAGMSPTSPMRLSTPYREPGEIPAYSVLSRGPAPAGPDARTDEDALTSASPGVTRHTDPPVRARRNRPWERTGCST